MLSAVYSIVWKNLVSKPGTGLKKRTHRVFRHIYD
jgi:hypothetical protein